MFDIVQDLGIQQIGVEKDGKYFILLDNSNDYQEMFELLDSNENLTVDEEDVEFNEDVNKVTFKTNDYRLDLVADFSKEKYGLIVSKIER